VNHRGKKNISEKETPTDSNGGGRDLSALLTMQHFSVAGAVLP